MARNRQRARDRKRRDASVDPLSAERTAAAWEHGGEVDEVEATLVAGADGEVASPEAADEAFEEASEAPSRVTVTSTPAPRRGPRFWQFLLACWAELKRVQWPDRQQVAQATAVVLAFVVIAGGYLGLADAVAQRVVDFIL